MTFPVRLAAAVVVLAALLTVPASSPTTARAASTVEPVPVAIVPAAECVDVRKLDVLMVGDSIMDRAVRHGGPQNKLAEWLGASCITGKVWNLAVDGSGLADGRYALKYLVRGVQPDVVLIGWEANDNIGQSDFRGNYLSALAEIERAKPGTKVVTSIMSVPIAPTPQWVIDQVGPKNDMICTVAFPNCPRSWELRTNVIGWASFHAHIKPATCGCTDGIHPLSPEYAPMWAWVWYDAMRGYYNLRPVPAPPGVV